ncbi:MAG: fibronectin-binding domain-containing protein [Promethearchaeota archaeon]|nr:MAG: fibronectin-binding domain-containing protein [Candidatus Lokiarchaeota archaeon]
MSSFDIAAIVSELKALLIDSWLTNVYQIDSLFTIKFRTLQGTQELLIEPGKRIHLTKFERRKPKVPSKFCMTLRKYLRNRRAVNIEQHQLDRVIILEVGRKPIEGEESQNNQLIVEFFERGNLVLLGGERKVIVALDYRTMRDRRIIPNREFNFAPSRGMDLKSMSLQDFQNVIETSELDLVRTIIKNVNIGPIYVEEACFRANLDKEKQARELNSDEIKTLYDSLIGLLNDSYNSQIYEGERRQYLSPIELKSLSTFESKKFKNFNEAADEYFSSKEEILIKESEIKDKSVEVSKTEKILRNQIKAIGQLEEESVRYKRWGDLIYQHFQGVDEIITSIKNARNEGRSWQEIIEAFKGAKQKQNIIAQLVKKINYKNGTLLLNLDGDEITLDFRKSVAENANIFYSKAKKAIAKLAGAKAAYEKLSKVKDQAESEVEVITTKEKKLREKRKKYWYEKFHWFQSSDNFTVIGGRDLKTNELIVRKYLEKDDVFFHAAFQGAPVVVIKSEGKEIPEQTLQEAAQFAVTFSKAWKSQHGQADLYCVKGEQVSLTPPSGEYLKKGSFIVRGKRREFKNTPLKLMLGLKFEEKFAIIMSGPPSAVMKHSDLYVEVKFGDKSSGNLAKAIKNRFLKQTSNEKRRQLVYNLPLDDIQRSLPSGTGDIAE